MFSLEHMPGQSVNNHLHSPINNIERAALDSSQTRVTRITTNEACVNQKELIEHQKMKKIKKKKQYHAPLK